MRSEELGTPLERARRLRREADEVLDLLALPERCAHIGPLTPTGSYFLDVMMYPDVDLYLPHTSPERLMEVGAALSPLPCVKSIHFAKGGMGELKDGLYLRPMVEHGAWQRPWKIDIWSLPREVKAQRQTEMGTFKRSMTPEARAIILSYKYRTLTSEGRTPMFSGIHLYRAVIDCGLTTFEEISAYLRSQGVDV
jgi:hypothetical protein